MYSFLALVVASVWMGGLLGDSARLREDILRLHVVAASDTAEDQAVKLLVRDALLRESEALAGEYTSVEEAEEYFRHWRRGWRT